MNSNDYVPLSWAAKVAAREAADLVRIYAELRDRLARCTDHDQGLAFGWLCDNHADLVNEALDETGAPS